MSSRQWWAIVAALLLVGGVASFAGAQGIAAPLDLTQSLPSGIELSGFWRHSDEAGSEWRLTVRDPSGELLPLGTDGEPELAPATGAVQPAGASLAPTRSLLLDASGPRSSGGPDTLLVQTAQTSLVRNLGLSRVLDRLGLTDSVLVSASPGLQDFDFAYGVGRVLPPYLRFGSRQWAHFLIAEVQPRACRTGDEHAPLGACLLGERLGLGGEAPVTRGDEAGRGDCCAGHCFPGGALGHGAAMAAAGAWPLGRAHGVVAAALGLLHRCRSLLQLLFGLRPGRLAGSEVDLAARSLSALRHHPSPQAG